VAPTQNRLLLQPVLFFIQIFFQVNREDTHVRTLWNCHKLEEKNQRSCLFELHLVKSTEIKYKGFCGQ